MKLTSYTSRFLYFDNVKLDFLLLLNLEYSGIQKSYISKIKRNYLYDKLGNCDYYRSIYEHDFDFPVVKDNEKYIYRQLIAKR